MIEAAPSRWFHSCRGGVRKWDTAVKVPAHSWIDEEQSHWCCPTCLNFGTPESTALWGHEWAIVAWMAAMQRQYAEFSGMTEVGVRQNTLALLESACDCDENCPPDCLLCENIGDYVGERLSNGTS